MPVVSSNVIIGQVDPREVWRVLRDFERYPYFMDDVLTVAILKDLGDQVVSEWKVLLNGSELNWTEQDKLIENESITFAQIDGDLEVWRGVWRLHQRDDGVHVTLDVTFDLGIPSLASILHPIGERAIRANSRQMLDAIRDRSLQSSIA